jgi:hypothetical protein
VIESTEPGWWAGPSQLEIMMRIGDKLDCHISLTVIIALRTANPHKNFVTDLSAILMTLLHVKVGYV